MRDGLHGAIRPATLCAWLVVTLATSSAHGGITTWIGPDGGFFDAPRNWSDGVPGVADTAIFETGGSFAVIVPSDAAVDRLLVRDGSVGFAVASALSGLSSSVLTPSIGVADVAGSVASLSLLEGMLFGGHGLIGGATNADGSVFVADGTTFAFTSTLVIGSLGNGQLALAGELVASHLEVGTSAAGVGSVSIDGGTASIAFTTIIGGFGTAALDTGAAGSLSTDELLVALNALSTGDVIVGGAGSAIGTIQKLRLAHAGSATLSIVDGGTVTVGTDMNVAALPESFLFPFFPSSFAKITIDGPGSTLEVMAVMRLGVLGIAELEVGPGGSMTIGDQMLVRNHPSTIVRLGIASATSGSDPAIDVEGAFAASTPGDPAFTVEVFADDDDAPIVGDHFTLIEAASIVMPPSIALPMSAGLLYTSSIEAVDDRVRLVVRVFGSPDLDGDGVVDGADLGMLLSQWGPCPGCSADLDGDGVVDGSDLGLLLANWSVEP